MYTQTEQKILEYTIAKVKELFTKYPVPAHSFPHAEAVGNYAKKIATHENASSVFVCEMAGYLHDIGRVPESYDLGYTNNSIDQNEKGHHELSYLLFKDWLQEDEILRNDLTSAQKNELLYSIRNHWNNFADRYDTAWILRDADKLDLFGERGLARQLEHNAPDETRISRSIRYSFDNYFWLRTKTAREIVSEPGMVEALTNYYANFLRAQIKDVHDYE